MKKIPQRLSFAILNSLSAGVVPRIGIEYIAVGRKDEMKAIIENIESAAQGASFLKFICGRYGSGKSFMLQIIKNYALDKNFIVADVDLAPDKLLYGANNQGLNTYRDLIGRLSIKTRSDGGALETIIQKWISNIRADIVKKDGLAISQEYMEDKVNNEIYRTIEKMKDYPHGFDFASVLMAYWDGYRNDEEKKQSALRWIRGEYGTKTEAKKYLPVSEIINDDSWYDFIKLLAIFFKKINYSGLLLFMDESVNLYKISNRITREKNYERLLSIYNDTTQGQTSSLGVFVAATPQFIQDERKGLYSYEAFRSRLKHLLDSRYKDFSASVMILEQLTYEEIYVLIEKVTDIHATHYEYDVRVTKEQIIKFIEYKMNRIGADELLTPRELLREYITILNIMEQNPQLTFNELFTSSDIPREAPIKRGMEFEL